MGGGVWWRNGRVQAKVKVKWDLVDCLVLGMDERGNFVWEFNEDEIH